MTHFIARFPQHNKPVLNPNPLDYFEAAGWYKQQNNRVLYERFYRTYYKLKWAHETTLRQIEQGRAG